ncbi:GntR family transcriptional regulator [Seohaeicola zhoushanensis]|uniref:GntR family transcriptional regulator n=1 Tax=Seohaeicola zhoushanensis TaxID=1569283 RepID=A0A8J3GZ24_9RHOB|nr:GntR family transcriptional regulator [Seohaeicola zhoushanensis]GHF53654.1 GntR family transcriptional regulator [Seohaeicola zhoushanensis]
MSEEIADTTLPEQIARQLRRDILRGKLAPGDPIKERVNAGGMGVSRTPMREAIRILAKEGLVILRPSRSPVVASPTLKEATDAIEVLMALELLSGELACKQASDADIAAIEAIQTAMEARYDNADKLDLFEIDMSLHRAIAEASHNASLAETHRAYLQRLWRVRYLSASQRESRERVLRQHREIVEGLKKRDAEQVRAAIQSHLEHLSLNVQNRFAKEAEEAARNGRG